MQRKFEDEFETVLIFDEIIGISHISPILLINKYIFIILLASTHNGNVKIWRVQENSEHFALKVLCSNSFLYLNSGNFKRFN